MTNVEAMNEQPTDDQVPLPDPPSPKRPRKKGEASTTELMAEATILPEAVDQAVAEVGNAAPAAGDAAATAEASRDAAVEELQELELEVRNKAAATHDRSGELAAGLLRLLRENTERLSSQAAEPIARMVRENLTSDYLDPDFWRGVGMVLQYQVVEARAFAERRIRGEYTIDAFGLDREVVEVTRPFATFLYQTWWRVTAEGLDKLPTTGPAALIANHAGLLPWDGAMVATAVLDEHSDSRLVRVLFDPWISGWPLLPNWLSALGQVSASEDHAAQLLGMGEMICAFPEGSTGAGKLYRRRYQQAEYSDSSAIAAALRAGAPIFPVAVLGAEEAYPMLFNFGWMARLLHMPFLPITLTFPWLGPLGFIPLPNKWNIVVHDPLDTSAYDPELANDPKAVAAIANQARSIVQRTLDARVKARTSLFL